MLAVAPLRNPRDEAAVGEPNFSIINDEFPDLSGDNLLDSIDFDDLFNGMEDEDHVLPALEMESDDIFAEFSVSGGEESETNNNNASSNLYVENFDNISSRCYNQQEEADKVSGSDFGSDSSKLNQVDDQIVAAKVPRGNKEDAKRNKSSKNQQGKRKVKVDWTPELHRRFVQAVEQLGVDKAVPSRILELMGIDCLTRHNIASHLQKYRSHRKHLLAREAEAANWSQRRQAYGAATGGGRGCKREMSNTNPWVAPTIGFPPIAPNNLPHFRPLHVWGHPSIEQPLMPVWPAKHLAPSHPPPPPMWPPSAAAPHLPPQPPDLSLWHSRYQRIGHSKITRTHGFPPSMAPARFAGPVPGMPPMYKVDPVSAPPHPPFDFHPSKECIDAAIGDVISKPWLPLPLGLKPPSTDSVVVELHRQGVENIPPTATCASTT